MFEQLQRASFSDFAGLVDTVGLCDEVELALFADIPLLHEQLQRQVRTSAALALLCVLACAHDVFTWLSLCLPFPFMQASLVAAIRSTAIECGHDVAPKSKKKRIRRVRRDGTRGSLFSHPSFALLAQCRTDSCCCDDFS